MRTATVAKAMVLTVALAALAAEERDASACGGCFVGQTENTQVTGHKMILSISQMQTTLYDQIQYSGNPSSFAWILPIQGTVTIGLSSDALFQALVDDTQVSIQSPQISCPPSGCGAFGGTSGAGGSFGGGTGGGVTVLAQQVVGPYQTVQLQSTDPMALENWLSMNGYTIPADVQPVVDAYVSEGFNFLALKLVPGQGVNAMRPVRVTTPGGSPTLPLRMVAAGTGAITPINLWVIAEGRFDTVNLPSFLIDPATIIWDWDTQSSNYASLKAAGFTNTQNKGWLVSAAEQFSMFQVQNQLGSTVMFDPQNSGYADANGQGAQQAFMDDMSTLFAGISPSNMWITHLEGELSRAALASDLQLSAASKQVPVTRFFQAILQKGTPPACPPPVPCETVGSGPMVGVGGAGGAGSTGAGWNFWGGGNGGQGGATAGGGCATTGNDPTTPIFAGAALVAALAFARRRLAAARSRG